jgi:hypothetical protein
MLDVFCSSECSERPRAVFRPQEKWPTFAATSVSHVVLVYELCHMNILTTRVWQT